MFNLFKELKNEYSLKESIFDSFTLVNLSNKAVYIEGHRGLISLSEKSVTIKLKTGCISITGIGLYIKILTKETLCIEGKIFKIEALS